MPDASLREMGAPEMWRRGGGASRIILALLVGGRKSWWVVNVVERDREVAQVFGSKPANFLRTDGSDCVSFADFATGMPNCTLASAYRGHATTRTVQQAERRQLRLQHKS